jgi:uncharacterized protein (DUF1800 family)
MHEITVKFDRYKLNEVTCTCGYKQYFDDGVKTRYAADIHAKRNTPAALTYFDNGVKTQPPSRTAKPGRHDGYSQGAYAQ